METSSSSPTTKPATTAVATGSSSSSNNNNSNSNNNVNVDDDDNVNYYTGWTIPSNNYEIERLEINNTNNNNANKIITPELFYELYVRQRKPVILCCSSSSSSRSSNSNNNNNNRNNELDLFLQTILGNESRLQKWTNLDYLTNKVAVEQTTTKVMVEKRVTNFDTFGKGNEIEMSFEKFINLIKNGDTKHYLTTQDVEATTTTTLSTLTNKPSNNNNDDDDDGDDNDDDDGDDGDYDDESESEGLLGGRPDLMSPFMKQLKDDFPLRPRIMGNLIPQNINLWIGGNSTTNKATTSGLHHDYHDNLYLVLKGQKRFRLYSPADTNKMYTRGKLLKVHTNGRINYINEETTPYGTDLKSDMAAKASREKDIAEQLLIKAEQDLHNNIPNAQQQLDKAELAMDNALQALLDAEISDNDNDDNDDEDEGDDDDEDFDEDDDESDDDDNDNEEEEENININDDDEADEDSKRKSKSTTNTSPTSPGGDDGQPPIKKQRRRKQQQSKKQRKQNHHRRRHRRIVDKTIKNPNNFSLIEPSILDDPKQLEENGYTKFNEANVAFCTINEGECLYLPASWFHEVQSSSGCNTTTTTSSSSSSSNERDGSSNTTTTTSTCNNNNNGYHMALNYWFHPPDATNNYEKPYTTDFWPNDYQQRFC